ncbi:MAG: leucine--tRNA ligase [Elusimicrobia bacterium]|nr:leucine--tRNA ligase [Elusimicrobiota bacterium]MBU2614510.1 leucine--tRNA ligase [Elusimicrobiota bacterium]
MNYDFKSFEPKWQNFWEEKKFFLSDEKSALPKFYCLVMFPYPSGKIHMGHVRNYVIGDVISQYKRMKGFNVFHPIGWDAFGLPAENAAIKNNIPPKTWTKKNIDNMREQLKGLGITYDWTREVATCDPEYYRWNQWFFIKMFERGLAYKKKSSVNWCPSCKTVLANEQVKEGLCWRCDSEVEEKSLEQWFFKITDYAERLLEGMDTISKGWPEEVITMQKNWIGKSIGAEVDFKIDNPPSKDISEIRIFTTRPDTLFGATFMVLAPEHPLLQLAKVPDTVKEYIVKTKKKTRLERMSTEKTGEFTGLYAINPMNDKKIPIWTADYVTMEYGTGAIMCVPAHDKRDYEFAKKFGLPIVEVIKPPENVELPYEEEGVMVNSGQFSDEPSADGREKIIKWLEEKSIGAKKIHFRIKDWLISRQRYWGTPIPIIYCDKCGILPVQEKSLPVLLPENIKITGEGESPLKHVEEFYITKCPKCGGEARRETDTMDTFVDSSWYFARYCDPNNENKAFDSKKTDYWLPVDQYIGGIEHACMHLIYSRFWFKLMKDLGMIKSEEPFLKLLTQGMVTLGGAAMSKSKGNIVEPSTIIDKYGTDTTRLFVLFAAPPEKQLDWQDTGIEGCWRFLTRIWRLADTMLENKNQKPDKTKTEKLEMKMHQTIQKVTQDLEKNYQFNTAISSIMELVNELYQYPSLGDEISKKAYETVITLISPFAPHLAEELNHMLGKTESIRKAKWPDYDPKKTEEAVVEIAVQINGKMRGTTSVPRDINEKDLSAIILKDQKFAKYLAGNIRKNIYVPNKIMNIVVEQ